MNDEKYGRLYPERAVAPVRDLLERMLTLAAGHKPGELSIKELGDALAALDELGFPPDEPLFLLRGQDVIASECVEAYAQAVFNGRGYVATSYETAMGIMAVAQRMREWVPRKAPD